MVVRVVACALVVCICVASASVGIIFRVLRLVIRNISLLREIVYTLLWLYSI